MSSLLKVGDKNMKVHYTFLSPFVFAKFSTRCFLKNKEEKRNKEYNYKMFNLDCDLMLAHGVAVFFCKGLESKHFRLYDLCHNY